MELAARLAEYSVSLRYSDLGPGVVKEMKARFVDSIGCALGAYSERPAAIARKALLHGKGAGRSTVIGSGSRTSAEHATFVNGLMVRYFDFNDTYLSKEPAHPSDNIAPCLAVAEAEKAKGKALLTAAVSAYEIQCRLCDAADIRHRGWDHVNYGLVSAALASAKLMGLALKESTEAVNISLNSHIAMRQVRAGELSMWKGASFANAARNAVFSATLAREGMTGPAPIFEGEMGFFNQVSGPFTMDVDGFGREGKDFKVTETFIKYWPAEYHAQTAIWASLEVREKAGSVEDADSILVETHEAGYTILGKDKEKWSPRTRETADHSLPYIVASALIDGSVDVGTYSDRNLGDRRRARLVKKVRVVEDPRLSGMYPSRGMPNRVTVERAGKKFGAEVDVPLGHPLNPVTRADLEKKFTNLAGPRLGVTRTREVLARLWDLEHEGDIAGLLGLLDVSHGVKA